jgi:hypothetical protein
MSGSKHTRAWLIVGMLFSLLVTHIPILYTLFYHELTGTPIAKEGMLSVSSPINSEKTILDGEWEFYWNQLIVTEQEKVKEPDFMIRVPDYWSKYELNGAYLPAKGVASYRLTLKDIESSKPIVVYIPDFGSAYRVFVNGELSAESGVVSRKQGDIVTTPKAKLYPVKVGEKGSCEIVIEVATTRFSGLYMAPVLQDYESVMDGISLQTGIRFILFGVVLFSLLVLGILYGMAYRKGLLMGWLPALIVCVLLRLMLTTEFYDFWKGIVFLNLNYEATNDFMFLATFVLKFLLIFLFQEQFDIRFSRKEKVGFFTYYAIIYLVHLLLPHGVYNRHFTLALPIATFLLEFYSVFKVYFSGKPLKKFGLPIYWGAVFSISGLIIDSYYINGNSYLNLSLVLIITLTLNLVILSLVYAFRVVKMYNEFLMSSASLSIARNQIAMQSQYYEALSASINEVRSVRHDLRHFVGVMKQLSSEGLYEELSQFLNEYGEKAETEPLPVYCENIVANSILGYYSLKAKEDNIRFDCASVIPRQLRINDTDLCTVLSNALENALEACRKLEQQRERFLIIEARNRNDQLLVKIQNSYNGEIHHQEGIYISGKAGEFHGLGIKNIQKVVELYGGYIKIEHDSETFTLMVAFPNP